MSKPKVINKIVNRVKQQPRVFAAFFVAVALIGFFGYSSYNQSQLRSRQAEEQIKLAQQLDEVTRAKEKLEASEKAAAEKKAKEAAAKKTAEEKAEAEAKAAAEAEAKRLAEEEAAAEAAAAAEQQAASSLSLNAGPAVSYDGKFKIPVNWSGLASEKGYKLVWSTSPNPVYPGADAQYFESGSTSGYIKVYSAGTYYIRVCNYTGDGCDTYSNQVTVTAP